MTEIKLTKGRKAIVDEDIEECLKEHSWQCSKDGYARRHVTKGNKDRTIFMHRFVWEIWNGRIPDGMIIDHINGDRLDNRLCNLRLVTIAESNRNRSGWGESASDYKGVTYSKKHEKWVARIKNEGTEHFLGYFDNQEEAAAVYNINANILFGEYARLNVLMGSAVA